MRKISILFLLPLVLFFGGCSKGGEIEAAPADEAASSFIETVTQTAGAAAENSAAETPAGAVNPTFSHEGGFYGESFSLELSAPDGVNSVRYTTNGDEPDKNSSKYEKPILLLAARESVTVRAACFDRQGNLLGNIVTNTYIKRRDTGIGLYILSISCDDEYLNGSEGIFTNPSMNGREWERPAHVEIYSYDGKRVINQDAGLRIFGGSSRALEQKSFRLAARKTEYFADIRYNGKGSFGYPFFKDRFVSAGEGVGERLQKYDRLLLRNGGNDSMQATAADPLRMNLLRDGTANNFALAVAPDVQSQASEFAAVYLNGQYYGLLDFKEDINDDYISNIYGIADKDNIAVLKSELDTTRHCDKHSNGGSCRFCNVWFYYKMDHGPESELDNFVALCKKAINSSETDRKTSFEELSSKLDMTNFIQYTALNLYLCNTDWPHNNLRLWRYTGDYDPAIPYTDGKWRFTLRDMDFTMGRYQDLQLPELYTLADADTFSRALSNYWSGSYSYNQSSGNYPDSLYIQGLLDFCLKNEGFRSEFISYCKTLASEKSAAQLKDIVTALSESIKAEIPYHLDRWKGSIAPGYTFDNWTKTVGETLDWVDKRPGYFLATLDAAMEHYN